MDASKIVYWRITLVVVIVILGGIIFYHTLPFLSGVLGACTVYVLVRNQMYCLVEKKGVKKALAAIVILLEVILCFLIPIFFILWLLTARISSVDLEPTALIKTIQHFIELVHEKVGYDLLSEKNMSVLTSSIRLLAQSLLNQISSFMINSIVLVFVLYFMLLGGRAMERYLYEILPFSEDNKNDIVRETEVMIKSNAIGVPLLAVIQGGIALIGYIIFGAPDPVMFGLLTCFATIIPLVGTALIWFPLALYLFLIGEIGSGIGLTLYSLVIISNVDNVIRFLLQKRLADTHPLITVFGVVLGLTIFGFWGVIFGPLLLSIFILCFNFYKKDYID